MDVGCWVLEVESSSCLRSRLRAARLYLGGQERQRRRGGNEDHLKSSVSLYGGLYVL